MADTKHEEGKEFDYAFDANAAKQFALRQPLKPEVSRILDDIYEASMQGCFQLSLNRSLSQYEVDVLIIRGFKVTQSFSNRYTISWL